MYATLNFIAIWLPRVFFGLVFVLAVLAYVRIRRRSGESQFNHSSEWWKRGLGAIGRISLRGLIIASIAFKFVYAALLTAGQYFVWKSEPFAHLLLGDSLRGLPASVTGGIAAFNGKLGYFFFYSWSRFWLDAIWAVLLALVFWFILKVLQKRNARFFYPGETEIGLIAALVVGWPDLLLFVPLVFLSVVLVAIYRAIFLREAYTTLGWPLLLAVILTLLAGHFFGAALGLPSWRIY